LSSRYPTGPLLLAAALVGAVLQLALLWGTDLPLGIPGEWTWTRVSFLTEPLSALLPALIAGLILGSYVTLCAPSVASGRRGRAVVLLLGQWALGTAWVLAQTASVPGLAGLPRAPFVLYFSRSSGYFTQARYEITDLNDFWSGYAERIADKDSPDNYLHLGTHPPGLTTALYGLLQACERWPALRELGLRTQPAAVREALEVVRRQELKQGRTVRDVDSASLWLAALIVAAASAGTCVPVFLLAARNTSWSGAWWAAGAWLAVPAIVVFFPKSDVLFPCLAMWGQWLWLDALDRRSFWRGALAGLVLFLALCLSLAFAPIVLILVLQWGLRGWRETDWRMIWPPAGALLCGLALWLGAWHFGQINLLAIWRQNLTNHAAFYAHHGRSYFLWLLENPVELALALGLPVALLGMLGCGATLQQVESPAAKDLAKTVEGSETEMATVSPATRGDVRRLEMLVPGAVWALLWLSGKNMGEAARLWVFLMPYAVIWGTPVWARLAGPDRKVRWAAAAFVVQLACCAATAVRIDGFHFAELLP
jgi:hypothetical protein